MAERFPFGFAAMNDNILYHALGNPSSRPTARPPFPFVNSVAPRIGPQQSRARSGEAYP